MIRDDKAIKAKFAGEILVELSSWFNFVGRA
jgi:hypothetical protein